MVRSPGDSRQMVRLPSQFLRCSEKWLIAMAQAPVFPSLTLADVCKFLGSSLTPGWWSRLTLLGGLHVLLSTLSLEHVSAMEAAFSCLYKQTYS